MLCLDDYDRVCLDDFDFLGASHSFVYQPDVDMGLIHGVDGVINFNRYDPYNFK